MSDTEPPAIDPITASMGGDPDPVVDDIDLAVAPGEQATESPARTATTGATTPPAAASPYLGDPTAADGATEPSGGGGNGGSGGPAASIDHALGAVRLGVGVALVLAPGWAGRIWVGPGADGPGSKVFARALGARDVALGIKILTGLQKGEPVAHWVAAGFAADAADVAATHVAGRHLTPGRRLAMPLVAGVVGAAGIVSGRRAAAEG
jgi:hypothetical protein